MLKIEKANTQEEYNLRAIGPPGNSKTDIETEKFILFIVLEEFIYREVGRKVPLYNYNINPGQFVKPRTYLVEKSISLH